MTAVYLNQFKVVLPKNRISQSNLLEWIVLCHQATESENLRTQYTIQKLLERYAIRPEQISQRFLECDDILSTDYSQNEIYQVIPNQQSGKSIYERTLFFSDRAYEVFNQFYDVKQKSSRPDHLIHVSCTGYISPSAAQKIVTETLWGHKTDVTHAYHMGCYAALPAVRMAKSFVISENQQTDIVHTEMCGLHMNPKVHTPEQMVVQTLFADGHVKYTATSKPEVNSKNLKIIALLEKLVPNSQDDMSWIPAPWGMQMNLSRNVPTKIKAELKQFSNELFKKAGLSLTEAMNSVYAVHPGGPKIIDSVMEVLELSESQISESRKILFERGNMSSATLPHVWDEILNRNYPIGTKVISYAFGPGLTLFGAVFEVC